MDQRNNENTCSYVAFFSDAVLNSKNIKTTIFILTILIGQITFAQNRKVKVQSTDNFYFYYGIAGMGSNMGSFQPTLKIYNNKFIFTKEQNSYWSKKSKKIEFISKGFLRQSSIDSILSTIEGLKDTTIYKVNPCIMSGAVIYLTIAHGMDTTKFTLHNTFDLTVLKIIDIINPYLPKDKKLYGSAEDVNEEEDCWTYLHNRVDKNNKDSTKPKQ